MARDFNGTADGLADATAAITATDNFTLAIWANLDSSGSEVVLLNVGKDAADAGDGRDGYCIEVESGNWKWLWNGIGRLDSGVAVSTGTWTHLAFRRASGSGRIYVNGSASGSSDGTAPVAPTARTSIGCQWDGTGLSYRRFVDGRLCEAAIWTAALDDAEIAALAKGFVPALVRPASLTVYWPVIGRTSPEVELRTGFGLALVGSPAAADHVRTYRPAKRPGSPFAAAPAGNAITWRLKADPQSPEGSVWEMFAA